MDFMMRMNCMICRNIPVCRQSASDGPSRMSAVTR
nr:MAG TPA: hypothetical protein [Caudoviricetes sp.]